MTNKLMKVLLLAGGLGITQSSLAIPMNVSFSGNFIQDDNVQLFNFTADGVSEVFLVSYGYGGGTNAAGTVIGPDGFDTILSLYEGVTGTYIATDDDGSGGCYSGAEALVPGIDAGNFDPNTGQRFDTCFSQILAAGLYTVAVGQFNNSSRPFIGAGTNLSDGFIRDGTGNFTIVLGCSNGMFCDFEGNNRSTSWAFDVLNVTSAELPPPVDVPEPGTLALLALGLMNISGSRRKQSLPVFD